MSSTNIFKERDLLSKIKPVRGVSLLGVGGNASAKEKETVSWLPGDIEAFYSSTSPANVLSCSCLKDHGYSISYDQESDSYTGDCDGDDIIFTCHGRVYACDIKKHLAMPFETVEGNKEIFTRGDVVGAERARQVAAGFGYPSDGVLLDMIRSTGSALMMSFALGEYLLILIWRLSAGRLRERSLTAPSRECRRRA